MDEFLKLVIHHSGEFVDPELNIYEGGLVSELSVDVDRWSYFELVGVLKDLGYTDNVEKMYYKDPQFGMNELVDDKGALEIADLYRVHHNVHVYIQHCLFQPEYYDDMLRSLRTL